VRSGDLLPDRSRASRKNTSPDKDVFHHIELSDWQWSADRSMPSVRAYTAPAFRFGYHNHNIDFQKYGSVVALTKSSNYRSSTGGD